MNANKYRVRFFESNDLSVDCVDASYVIADAAQEALAPHQNGGLELGIYDSIDAARRAILEDAAELGAQLDESYEGSYGIERWNIGEFRLLTPQGTRSRYAEWAYEVAEDATDEDIERMVEEAVRGAHEQESPRPDPDALADQLRFYRQNRDEE